MAIDWDANLLAPVMAVFGEGTVADPTTLPLYTPRSGSPFRVADAVFDECYTAVIKDRDGNEINTVSPVLGVRDALFSIQPIQGDAVTIPRVGKTYLVMDAQPDSHGKTLLILNERAP